MKKKYTKKQITEAIAYWKKILNERFISTIFGNDTHDIPAGSYIVGKYMKYASTTDVYITCYFDDRSKSTIAAGKIPAFKFGENLVSAKQIKCTPKEYIEELKRWQSKGEDVHVIAGFGAADTNYSTWRSGAVSKHRYSRWEKERSSGKYSYVDITDLTGNDVEKFIDSIDDLLSSSTTRHIETIKEGELNEGTSVYDDNTFAVLDDFKPTLDRFIGFSKDAMTASGKGVNYWNEVMWLMFALANYVEKECPTEDNNTCTEYVDLAKQINSIGKQKMQ